MSMKQFQCPSCGASLDYEESRALTMRCPYCNSSVIVPESLRVATGTNMGMGAMDSVLGDLPTAQLAEVARLIQADKKIEAIKVFRDTFQVGLKEAKDAVDQMEAGQAVDITRYTMGGGVTALSKVDGDTYAEAQLLIQEGDKIGAVNLLRRNAGLDWEEAKSAADQIEAGASAEMQNFSSVTVVTAPGTTLDGETSAEIQRLMQSGNKIAAIKLMREKTGLGLAEAKNAVEAMEMAYKVAGFFGGTPTITNMSATTAPDGLVTVVDSGGTYKPSAGGERRGCGGWFWALVLMVGLLIFVPMPWGSFNDTLNLPANLIPANGQSLWQKYTSDFPTDLGVAMAEGGSTPLLTFGSSGTGQGAFSDPRHITLDGEGNVYVADTDSGRVQRFTTEGEFQSVFRLDAEPIMGVVATRDGDLHIIQSGQIGLYDGESGDELDTISLGGLFSIATHVNLAPDGSLLAAVIAPDEQVVRLNRRGNNTNRLNINNPFTSLTGQREVSMFVAEDGVGNIYVAGGTNNTILKFSGEGVFLNQFGAAEMGAMVSGIAVDSKGRLYVPHFNGISVFDDDGRHLTLMDISDGIPHSVAIGADDTVWVVTSTSKVMQYPAVEE